MQEDYVIRGIAENAMIRAFVARSTQLCEKARRSHDTWPTATAALGRVLTAAAMLGMTLKGEDILTLRIQGDGPLGQLLAVSKADGLVKGYVAEPHVHLPLRQDGKLDVGAAVGRGMLYLTRDLGLKEPYTGSSTLVSGEIGEDLTHYLAVSEQTPSAVALGVLVDVDNSVKGAGGFLVQLLPGAPDTLISQLEDNIAGLAPISQLMAAGTTPEELLQQLFQGFAHEVLASQHLDFRCDCTRAKLERILISLGIEELELLQKEEKGAELRCHYCNEVYHFSEDDLTALLGEIGQNGKKES